MNSAAADANRRYRHQQERRHRTTKAAFMSVLFLSLASCLPVELGIIGADYLGLNPKKMADRAETEAIIKECEKNPSGYVKKDGVTTSTPCSGVLTAYHQAVMEYCHKNPSRSVEIKGTKQKCSKVFEDERVAIAARCKGRNTGYVTINGKMQPCPAAYSAK